MIRVFRLSVKRFIVPLILIAVRLPLVNGIDRSIIILPISWSRSDAYADGLMLFTKCGPDCVDVMYRISWGTFYTG